MFPKCHTEIFKIKRKMFVIKKVKYRKKRKSCTFPLDKYFIVLLMTSKQVCK